MDVRLFLTNIPYNCSDFELQNWVESTGIQTRSIRMIRDLVTGVSPAFAYVELGETQTIDDAVEKLNGRKMRTHTIQVKAVSVCPRTA
jgi:RNA recognition motif-containing protein